MMIGDIFRPYPTVQIPPWDFHLPEDPTGHVQSPFTHTSPRYEKALTDLQRYEDDVVPEEDGLYSEDFHIPADAFSCDEFRMFEFKVKKCSRVRPHDWTECPFAHPGEKARRRDPRKYHYSGTACPDFRNGACKGGDGCEYAHGVFECWLHPARYRTHPCKDGTHCRRRVCFFAHTPDQLRVLPYSSPDGSPGRVVSDSRGHLDLGSYGYSPRSKVYSPAASPAESPPGSMGQKSLSQLTESFTRLKLKNGMGMSLPSWGFQMGSGLGSPRSPSATRVGHMSLPNTPNRVPIRSGRNAFDIWETSFDEEEPVLERVESGRQLRERIYAKLSKENSLDRVDPITRSQ